MSSSLKHMDFRTGDMPQADIIILTHKLKREYVLGAETVHALQGISVQIKRNEFTAIMGPSGSGKSTLMNLIGCLDSPTSGTYILNEREISTLDDKSSERSGTGRWRIAYFMKSDPSSRLDQAGIRGS